MMTAQALVAIVFIIIDQGPVYIRMDHPTPRQNIAIVLGAVAVIHVLETVRRSVSQALSLMALCKADA